MKRFFFSLALLLLVGSLWAQPIYLQKTDVPYYPKAAQLADAYLESRCVLDVYYPADVKGFPTVVWFHGGGLTGGNKHIPEGLKNKGIAVVAVNYRLYPQVKSPVYIHDAAAAVAWVFRNIGELGGNDSLVFVSGHSAGGYLAAMVGLDPRWLADFEKHPNQLAGIIPFSGHTITHFTIREERGIAGTTPVVDDLAPLYHVRADAPPVLLITGDREKELLGRYEENAYLWRMMQLAGHKQTRLLELDGYGHDMVYPAIPLLVEEVLRISEAKKK
jgi:acetyl esterase/lipase